MSGQPESSELSDAVSRSIHAEEIKSNAIPDPPKAILRKRSSIHLDYCEPLELVWNKLVINATLPVPKNVKGKRKMVKIQKPIINRIKGVLRPGQFTAILGPSGSGKTTLLNFLAGRMVGPNLDSTGELYLNSQRINSIDDYSDRIGYVTQDDILFSTMTPRESFYFTANLKLKISYKDKVKKVESLIRDLGLSKCANTMIGNAMMRGISGGERKRTSIGVELLLNPGLLFLDEPTTGLDSSTALQVMEILKDLARAGKTIVSTIHQPSSEIFVTFDRLILVVRGNIIYQGEASEALNYFAKLGFECPKFNNPSDFFMKLMNEEGLLVEKIMKGIGI